MGLLPGSGALEAGGPEGRRAGRSPGPTATNLRISGSTNLDYLLNVIVVHAMRACFVDPGSRCTGEAHPRSRFRFRLLFTPRDTFAWSSRDQKGSLVATGFFAKIRGPASLLLWVSRGDEVRRSADRLVTSSGLCYCCGQTWEGGADRHLGTSCVRTNIHTTLGQYENMR